MIAKCPRFYNVLSLTKIFRNKVYCSVVRKSINRLFIIIIPHIFACACDKYTIYNIMQSNLSSKKKIFIIFTTLLIMTLCPLLV